MKTIQQAIIDEIYYPIPEGLIENKLIERGLSGDDEYTTDVFKSKSFKGALADCLSSLVQAISVSEADKSFGALTSEDKKMILSRAKDLYKEIGEKAKYLGLPTVTIL